MTASLRSSLARVALHLYARAMRILVTGGAGFIGSHLAEKLLVAGHDVSILDDFNDFYDPQIKRANIATIEDQIAVHHIDLRDSGAVRTLFHREKFDAIAHLAARAGVRPSIQQPQLYYDTNVGGTLHLLQAACSIGVERFIFASSSSVYGISKTVPFSEELASHPNDQPICGHQNRRRISLFHLLASLPAEGGRAAFLHGLRSAAATGPGDPSIHPAHSRRPSDRPVRRWHDAAGLHLHRRHHPGRDGFALQYEGPLFDIFNLGENETIQLKDLIAAIEAAVGRKAKINRLPEQAGDMPLTCADISKARKLLGYNPTTSLNEGLPKFVEWLLR